MNLFARAALAAASIAIVSTHSFAATTVTIEETGEGGGPMAIKMDMTKVPAGEVVFKVTNQAMTEVHEMVLVKLKNKDVRAPVASSKHRIDEAKLKTLGEVTDLKPSQTGELKADLKPGAYALLCNIKGHYEAGMWTPFTVN